MYYVSEWHVLCVYVQQTTWSTYTRKTVIRPSYIYYTDGDHVHIYAAQTHDYEVY